VYEQAAFQSLVAQAIERMRQEGGQRLIALDVVLRGEPVTEGTLRLHLLDAIRGTPAEGARLHIDWAPPSYRCLGCQSEFSTQGTGRPARCPRCGSPTTPLINRGPVAHLRGVEIE
jgi:Zn finger protein HypA/HybF involved in hydrogenase expression